MSVYSLWVMIDRFMVFTKAKRYSLAFVSYKDRKAVAAALKEIYKAKDADAGKEALEDFADGPWGTKYPAIAQSWRRNWPHVIRSSPFLPTCAESFTPQIL